jgi:hypothetical protein
MKYTIDEEVCRKHKITLTEMLCLLLAKSSAGNIHSTIDSLVDRQMLFCKESDSLYDDPSILPTTQWDDIMQSVLLESDSTIPSDDRIVNLVNRMRELFPKGMKVGNSAWRGNVRELKLRMQKFFKLYGDYKDEDILAATRKYVESFNGDYTYMRILKYFILKSELKQHQGENGEAVTQVEDISLLANIIDNPDTEIVKRTRLI